MASSTSSGRTLLEVRGLSKSFGESLILDRVDITITSGQVQGILGANGAGKSTLVKHLSGYHQPNSCESLQVRSNLESWPLDTVRNGIVVIHQDQALAENLSVLDNFLATRSRRRQLVGWLHRGEEAARCAAALERVSLKISPHAEVARLTPGERSLLVIARALEDIESLDESVRASPIVILDEPTASLSSTEASLVLEQARTLADRGAGVLLVAHRLQEVREAADIISVLRDGRCVYSGALPESDVEIETLMFGTPPSTGSAPGVPVESASFPPSHATTPRAVISTARATDETERLTCYDNEVLGVTGLVGRGFEQLPYQIIGAVKSDLEVQFDGAPIKFTPRTAGQHAVRLIPGNRKRDGVWLSGSVVENLGVIRTENHGLLSLIRTKSERDWVSSAITAADVVPHDIDKKLATFSGGNQQKVVMARWISGAKVSLLLVHEPTQGVDLRARETVLGALRTQAHRSGAAVVVFSSDYEALASVADRVVIWRDGRVVGEMTGDFTESELEARVLFGERGTAHTQLSESASRPPVDQASSPNTEA